MIHFAGTVTCPSCDIPLTLVAASREMVTERSAILRCPRCKVEQQLLMRLIPVAEQLTGRCGTEAGHGRHRKAGEEPCEACLAAHSAYNVQHRRERNERAKEGV